MKIFYSFFLFLLISTAAQAQKIDRKALVQRHTVINNQFDSLSSLSVGNGAFAFTVDVTGLQSFPEAYVNGVPLGTQSEWGWHSFVDTANYKFDETLRTYTLNGRKVTYSVQIKEPARIKNASDWFRVNPHRLQLGSIGFEIVKKDGSLATISDIQNIKQTLNMWTGEILSDFTVEGVPVHVSTFGHQQDDLVSVHVDSKLLAEGRLMINIRFPYPTGSFLDGGAYWKDANKHQSSVETSASNTATLLHRLDTTSYYLACKWNVRASISQKEPHYFLVKPSGTSSFEFSGRFSSTKKTNMVAGYIDTKNNNTIAWANFWNQGAAVDFAGSTDNRAKELERRIILSQYLTKIQCGGMYPPQESGLTYNTWFGKPHLEMHWWHGLHFALWNRLSILEKQMSWYEKVAGNARKIAARQGYKGVRWQKMTDPAGEESPSSVGAFLIWQQPHFITFAEQYRLQKPEMATLKKYGPLVFETADFMASFARYDSTKKKYVLGKGLIPAQERFKAEETFNPTYELVYWSYALNIAQDWRVRMGMKRNKLWDDVLNNLSPLPIQGDKYLATESATDSYTNPEFRTDHPSVLGAYGMLPKGKMLDTAIMRNTYDWIMKNWTWSETWGWDFPMVAMTATRMNEPEQAIEALLMPIKTNTYLNNGHNYQDDRLRLYLPGNGGLLTAVALMCAGYKGNTVPNPGIPKDGKWKVKWEGLRQMW